MDDLLQLTKLALNLYENVDYFTFAIKAYDLIDKERLFKEDIEELHNELKKDKKFSRLKQGLNDLLSVLYLMMAESEQYLGISMLNKDIIEYLVDNYDSSKIKNAEFKTGNLYSETTLDITGLSEYKLQILPALSIHNCWREYTMNILSDCYSIDEKLPSSIYDAIDFDYIIDRFKEGGIGHTFSSGNGKYEELYGSDKENPKFYVLYNSD